MGQTKAMTDDPSDEFLRLLSAPSEYPRSGNSSGWIDVPLEVHSGVNGDAALCLKMPDKWAAVFP